MSLLSIRQAAEKLGVDRMYLAGVIRGLGIKPEPGGTALLLNEKQLRLVEKRLEGRRVAPAAKQPIE